MTYNKRHIGTEMEKIAGKYLEENGYHILEYNYRCKQGEIDIIAYDGEYLAFCEVKYRSGDENADPLEAVDYKKQKRISKTAFMYVTKKHKENCPCRFDVVSVTDAEIKIIKNAFDYIGC